MLINDLHHLTCFKVLEARPAEIVVRLALVVSAFRKNTAGHGEAEVFGLAFLDGVEVVEPLDEHEESELFDHRKRI